MYARLKTCLFLSLLLDGVRLSASVINWSTDLNHLHSLCHLFLYIHIPYQCVETIHINGLVHHCHYDVFSVCKQNDITVQLLPYMHHFTSANECLRDMRDQIYMIKIMRLQQLCPVSVEYV